MATNGIHGSPKQPRQGGNGVISSLDSEILQFSTFFLNNEMFGLNILDVQEIQMPQPITPIPTAPAHILGLISLRGQIVTLVELRKRLNMPTTVPHKSPYHIVVKAGASLACLEVGAIGDVINVPRAHLRKPPDSVTTVNKKFLAGVYQMKNRILTILKAQEILEAG